MRGAKPKQYDPELVAQVAELYGAGHSQHEGAPSLCSECGATEGRFEWASLTKNYTDVHDYIRLCASCHHRMDGTIRNITGAE